MFIGHFALGFAAKRAAPRVSLAVLFSAAQFADMLWPLLVAAGVERVRIDAANLPFLRLEFLSYPYSHSLLMLAIWGALFGVVYRAAARHDGRAFAVIAALVVSHWVLDFATHRPDMPVYPGGPKVGLGLWYSTAATMVIEFVMLACGVWIYMGATRARDRAGSWGIGSLVALLVVAYIGSIPSAPPSVTAVWSGAIVGAAVILVWSWWADRHRDSTSQREASARRATLA